MQISAVMSDMDWNRDVWPGGTSLELEGDRPNASFCREAEARHARRLGVTANVSTGRSIRAADDRARRLGVFG